MPICSVFEQSKKKKNAKEIGRTEHDVGQNLVVGHLHVADCDTETEDFLELELDR